jgi:hypothetical protein
LNAPVLHHSPIKQGETHLYVSMNDVAMDQHFVHDLIRGHAESAFIPFVSFGDLDNNTFKGLTSLLSVEQGIQYDEHT